MTYRTYQDMDLVGELEVSYESWMLDGETLKLELEEQGLGLEKTGPEEFGMHIITPLH